MMKELVDPVTDNKFTAIALKRAITLNIKQKNTGTINITNQMTTKQHKNTIYMDWLLSNLSIKPDLHCDKIPPVLMLGKNYNLKIEARNKATVNDSENNILIFTGGSKDQLNHTGFGIA